MTDSQLETAPPTFRDVFAQMKPIKLAWLGAAGGVLFTLLVLATLLAFGVVQINSEGLVRLDSENVELQIQADYENNEGVIAQVDCPQTLVAPPNFSFRCVAQSGASVAFLDVTIVDSLGNILWVPQADLPRQ